MASERLRELNALPSRGRDVYPILLDALPLIADVVEAAEQTIGVVGGSVLHTKLPSALSALREALEET